VTAIQEAARIRHEDATDALAEYDQTPRWRWRRRGDLLRQTEILTQDYARLIVRVWQEADCWPPPPDLADESC
jgi:hypothetical protein